MRSKFAYLLLLVVLACSILPAAIATAEPVALDATTIQIQLGMEAASGSNYLIVGGTLPTDTPLPATVRLPLPEGAEVVWAGEIVGSTPAGDIERPYTIVDGQGGRAIEFTLDTYRSFQYDAAYGPVIPAGQFDISLLMSWRQTVASRDVSIGVRIPANATDIVIEPAPVGEPLRDAATGDELYVLPGLTLGLGDKTSVSISYARGGALDSGSAGGSPIVLILVGLLVLAVVALVFVWRAQARRRP